MIEAEHACQAHLVSSVRLVRHVAWRGVQRCDFFGTPMAMEKQRGARGGARGGIRGGARGRGTRGRGRGHGRVVAQPREETGVNKLKSIMRQTKRLLGKVRCFAYAGLFAAGHAH